MKHLKLIIFLIIGVSIIFLNSVNFASAGWSTGKYNSAIDFNGSSTYIDGFGAIGNIQTVSFWIKADSTTKKIMELRNDGSAYIEVSGGTITATGFTSPTIYVDGKISSTLPDITNWHHIAITTATAVSASAVKIGKATITAVDYFFDGKLDEVRLYNYARSADEIRLDYQSGYATHLGPSGKTCSEDPASCMDQGLVGNWGMDEGSGQTAFDASGNSNNGRLGSSSTADVSDPKWSKGKNGGGLAFDGKDDYVNAGNAASLNIQGAAPFSVSFWIKHTGDGVSPYPRPLYKQRYVSPTDRGGWIVFLTNAGSLGFQTNNNINVSSSTTISKNIWYHVIATYDGTNQRLYVDAVLKDTDASTGTGTHAVADLTFGSQGGYFNGSIDEVRIYNRALSAEEVRYHYNRGGPVAEWKFDEGSGTKAFDSTENNNNGTLVGATHLPTWTAGKYGSALTFDGTEDYVNAGNKASLNMTNAITISAWVKLNTLKSNDRIVNKYAHTDASINSGYYLKVANSGYLWMALFNNNAHTVVSPSPTITAGSWYHIVGTFNGAQENLYINGVNVKSAAWTTPIGSAAATPLRIGINYGDTPNGSIDEVRIYNYARSADEIRLDYQAGYATHLGPSGKTCSEDPASCMDYGLVGNWGMDEGSGQTAFDASGNSNNGRLGSSSTADVSDPKWSKGKNGGALKFDGVDDYVNAGNDASLNITNAITIEAWVERRSSITRQAIYIKGYNWGTLQGVRLAYREDSGRWELIIGNGTAIAGMTSATAVSENTWTHLVATWDGNGDKILRIYTNGVSTGTTAPTLVGPISYTSLYPSISSGSSPFNGSIDEVRIYNRALSAEEVRYHYNRGGPVAEWKFDEGSGTKAFDSTENNNNGTLTGATHLPTWTAGKFGSALNFDGVDDYVDAGNGASLNITNAATVEAWVNPSVAQARSIIMKGTGTTTNYGLDNTGTGSTLRFFGYASGSAKGITSGSPALTVGVFSHVVGTFDGTEWKIYVNGIEVITKTQAATLTPTTQNVNIGSRGTSSYWAGSIDDVRIYNYARTAAQILTDYNAGMATHLK